ncbi:MAG: phosphate ABC transporter, permease protein PstA, partial [candidate division Zixibacteria bacterium]|nr:phosphate ABC transporter, permease protein PstA [candidate division Zixibacteria bacterium]
MKRPRVSGDSMIWFTGGSLAISLLMVVGLVWLVLFNALGFFWPQDLYRIKTGDGHAVLGSIVSRETIPAPDAPPGTEETFRIQVKQGNRDLYGIDFVWIDEAKIVERDMPAKAAVIERLEWGNFHGVFKTLRDGEQALAEGPEDVLRVFEERFPVVVTTRNEIRRIETDQIGVINAE